MGTVTKAAPAPIRFSDWNSSRLHIYEGTCHVLLGDAAKAVTVLDNTIRALESDLANVNVLLAARVDLALAYAHGGDLEHGCQLLADTYARLTDIGNYRGINRARRARTRLARWNHERPVRELDARINDYEPPQQSTVTATQSAT